MEIIDITPAVTVMQELAANTERILTMLVKWQEEDRHLLDDIDHRLGRLSKVVADHEERLAS